MKTNRSGMWSFAVGDNDDDAIDGKIFGYRELYADGEQYAAGWITEDEACAFIEKAVKLYEERPR
jgi:hypothetical protein